MILKCFLRVVQRFNNYCKKEIPTIIRVFYKNEYNLIKNNYIYLLINIILVPLIPIILYLYALDINYSKIQNFAHIIIQDFRT